MPSAKPKAKESTKAEKLACLEEVKAERDLLQQRIELLEKASNDRKAQDAKNLEFLENQRNNLLTNYRGYKADNRVLTTTVNALAREKESLEAKLRNATRGHPGDFDDIKRSLAASDKQNQELRGNVADLTSMNRQLEKRANRLAGERDDLIRKVDRLSYDLDEAYRSYNVNVTDIRGGFKSLDDLIEENKQLHHQLKDEQHAHKKTKAEANQVKATENRRIKQLEERLREVEVMKSYLEDELDASQQECIHLNSKVTRGWLVYL
ncbi:hypothetical protein PgNI_05519 [Pyricularia grisea]|uniref:Uncharacterized protein n=1 Tax=Pyricularia grisea TaxID=148305 RepID=A0A6P8B3V5_PYRGI|nr:hypothetical protein PgNI_05519 [Pyricularia grisea]TLD09958.1 hypothetical protein PgNI_05519 [Pyricularia grisea]